MWKQIYLSSQSVLGLPRYAKRIIALIVDITFCILTVWLSFYLRLGEFVSVYSDALWALLLSIIFAIPIFVITGLYRAIFRYSGFPAFYGVLRAIFVYFLLYSSVITAIGINGIPRTIGIIQPLLLLFCVGGSRVFIRFWLGDLYQSQLIRESLPKALVYGAGSAGRQIVSALENSFEMQVMGYIDDDDRLQGQVLNTKPIFSLNDLSELVLTKKITHVLLALPSVSRHRRGKIIKKLSTYPVVVRTLPSFGQIADGRVTISDIQDLDVEDLLGREVISPNQILLSKDVSNSTILITGAGGSIGSEICKQVIKLKPTVMLLLELNEYALYTIQSELIRLSKAIGTADNIKIVPIIGSVQDNVRVSEILEIWKPNTIYHAAAYKHVPMVEYNLSEGLKNNVFGTMVLAKASIEKEVSNFVMISTDKAVRPTNVMGASKRLAEIILQALFEHFVSDKKTKFSMVRFGNVLNSSGSVIPLFKQQIIDGGPVTLTHKDITRYFMTVSEAAELVIQAGAMAEGGDVFVLDMGEPIKIFELAKRMITLSGLKIKDKDNEDGDIEISIMGLRPGEKLYEELLLGDSPKKTAHIKILRAQDKFIKWSILEKKLQELELLLKENDAANIIKLLKELVPEYTLTEKIVDNTYIEKVTN